MTGDLDIPGAHFLAEYAERFRDGNRENRLGFDLGDELRELKTAAIPAIAFALAGARDPRVGSQRTRKKDRGRQPPRRKPAHVKMLLTSVCALAELGPAAAPALGALVGVLKDTSVRVRCAAIDALAWMGPAAADAVPALLDRIARDRHPTVRQLSAWALGEIGSPCPEITAALVPLLDARHPQLRESAAVTLGKLARGDDAVGRHLEDAFFLDTANRPALAAALARVAPDRLLGFAVRQPDLFYTDHSDGYPSGSFPRKGWESQSSPSRGTAGRPFGYHGFHTLKRLTTLGPEAGPVRELFVRLLRTHARDVALVGLTRVGAAARDTLPAIAERWDAASKAATRAITFAAWHEDERRANADPTRWREVLLERLRARWEQRPLQPEVRAEIEDRVRNHSRRDVLAYRLWKGDVPARQVALAAQLGDEAARQALNWPDEGGDIDDLDRDAFQRLQRSLEALAPEARLRIAHAAARDVMPLWLSYYSYSDCTWGPPNLHAVEDWMREPGPRHRDRVAGTWDWGPSQGDENPSASRPAHLAAELVLHPDRAQGCGLDSAVRAWQAYLEHVREIEAGWRVWYFDSRLDAKQIIRRLLRVVREWVVPWALCEVDPVSEALH